MLYFVSCLDLESVIKNKMYKVGQIWHCSDCSYQSQNNGHVYEHIEAKHVEHTGYACSFCDKIFKTKASFGRHRRLCTNSLCWMTLLWINYIQ